jgi:hypothetical protein
LSKVLYIQIRLIYETNRKLAKFSAHSTNVLCVPLGPHDTRPGGSRARSTQYSVLKMNESFIVTLYFSSLACVLHAHPTLFFLIESFYYYWARSTYYGASNYGISCRLLKLSFSAHIQIPSSHPLSVCSSRDARDEVAQRIFLYQQMKYLSHSPRYLILFPSRIT